MQNISPSATAIGCTHHKAVFYLCCWHTVCQSVCHCVCTVSPVSVGATVSTDPGSPPASITFASVTSFDQTSYCHFLRPSTPHSTRPVCRPTRMFRSTSVASTTDLQGGDGGGYKVKTVEDLKNKQTRKRNFHQRGYNSILCLSLLSQKL